MIKVAYCLLSRNRLSTEERDTGGGPHLRRGSVTSKTGGQVQCKNGALGRFNRPVAPSPMIAGGGRLDMGGETGEHTENIASWHRSTSLRGQRKRKRDLVFLLPAKRGGVVVDPRRKKPKLWKVHIERRAQRSSRVAKIRGMEEGEIEAGET